MALAQNPALRPRAAAWLAERSDLALTALASLTETSGSFLLTYLLACDGLPVEALIEACTLEERFSLQTWGDDAQAAQLLAAREGDLRAAAQMLNLLNE